MFNHAHETTTFELQKSELPLCCPPNSSKGAEKSHPIVYLRQDNKGRAKCPYCGTKYQIKNN